jgi:hypothetical protein
MACLRPGYLAVAALLALATSACHSHRVRVQETRGPDGATGWKRISCPHLDKKCFSVARSMCPNGYYFIKQSEWGRPAPERARERRAAESPRAGVNTKTLPPEEKWGRQMYSRKPGTLVVQCASGQTSI